MAVFDALVAPRPPLTPSLPLGRSVLLFDSMSTRLAERQNTIVVIARLVVVAAEIRDDEPDPPEIGALVEWPWFFRVVESANAAPSITNDFAAANLRRMITALAPDLDLRDLDGEITTRAVAIVVEQPARFRGRCVMSTVDGSRVSRSGTRIHTVRWVPSVAEEDLLYAAAERRALIEPDEGIATEWSRIAIGYQLVGRHWFPSEWAGPVRS